MYLSSISVVIYLNLYQKENEEEKQGYQKCLSSKYHVPETIWWQIYL